MCEKTARKPETCQRNWQKDGGNTREVWKRSIYAWERRGGRGSCGQKYVNTQTSQTPSRGSQMETKILNEDMDACPRVALETNERGIGGASPLHVEITNLAWGRHASLPPYSWKCVHMFLWVLYYFECECGFHLQLESFFSLKNILVAGLDISPYFSAQH